MEGRAAFFQYVFPIRILLQLFAITAGIKFGFLTEKKMCKVLMRLFEIVAHRNVDNWTE